MLQIDARRDASPAADPGRSKVLVLSETESLEGRKPFLLDHLTAQERDYVIRQCTPKLAKRSSMIFRQGETQKGIFLILSGGGRYFTPPLRDARSRGPIGLPGISSAGRADLRAQR